MYPISHSVRPPRLRQENTRQTDVLAPARAPSSISALAGALPWTRSPRPCPDPLNSAAGGGMKPCFDTHRRLSFMNFALQPGPFLKSPVRKVSTNQPDHHRPVPSPSPCIIGQTVEFCSPCSARHLTTPGHSLGLESAESTSRARPSSSSGPVPFFFLSSPPGLVAPGDRLWKFPRIEGEVDRGDWPRRRNRREG